MCRVTYEDAHAKAMAGISRTNAAKLGVAKASVQVRETALPGALEIRSDRVHLGCPGAEAGNHWCFSRVFHKAAVAEFGKCRFYDKGAFQIEKLPL
jgi:hypothetical protein